jgi:hypothetical protein
LTDAQNVEFTMNLLRAKGVRLESAVLVSRPYQERRACATCKKTWPDLNITCTSHRPPIDEYGYAIPQEVPADVRAAYERLVEAGCTSRSIS